MWMENCLHTTNLYIQWISRMTMHFRRWQQRMVHQKVMRRNKVIYKSDQDPGAKWRLFLSMRFRLNIQEAERFRFTETGSKLKKFKRDVFGIGNSTWPLKTEKELRDKQLNATAEQVFEYLRNGTLGSAGTGKMFDIDKSYSKKDALKIMSVRYSAFLSRLFSCIWRWSWSIKYK